jgi:glycerol kinase
MQARQAAAGPLSIDGGMSNNPYFSQFLADILGREVIIPGSGELTAIGTANLVAETLGMPIAMAGSGKNFTPRKDRRESMGQFSKAVKLARSWP